MYKNSNLLDFCIRWALGGPRYLKNVVVGCGNNFHYRGAHSENFIFSTFFSTMFRLSQLDTHFQNSGAKNAHAMAPCLSLTHPERCATKFCAGGCQKFLRISHLRPNREQNVVPKCLRNCLKGPLLSVVIPDEGPPSVGNGRPWNGNGTEMEQKWNADGTEMERKWNGNGTEMERKWNGNRTQHQNRTEMERK